MNRLTSTVLLILSFLVIVFTIAGNHGLLHLQGINNEQRALEKKNKEIKSEMAALRNEIHGIKSSNFLLEKKAREELSLSKPGEILYVFPKSDSNR